MLARARQQYLDASSVALVYDGLDDTAHAMDWLQRGFDERGWSLTLLAVEPKWDRLRSDPRFQRLLKRMRLG